MLNVDKIMHNIDPKEVNWLLLLKACTSPRARDHFIVTARICSKIDRLSPIKSPRNFVDLPLIMGTVLICTFKCCRSRMKIIAAFSDNLLDSSHSPTLSRSRFPTPHIAHNPRQRSQLPTSKEY